MVAFAPKDAEPLERTQHAADRRAGHAEQIAQAVLPQFSVM
jgi:hypothetical protein